MSPFLVIWACPLTFEFLELLCLFGFLTTFSLFLLKFFLAPSVGCDLSRDFFFMKEKLFRLKKGLQGMYLYSESERNNKDSLSSFQAQAAMINKL